MGGLRATRGLHYHRPVMRLSAIVALVLVVAPLPLRGIAYHCAMEGHTSLKRCCSTGVRNDGEQRTTAELSQGLCCEAVQLDHLEPTSAIALQALEIDPPIVAMLAQPPFAPVIHPVALAPVPRAQGPPASSAPLHILHRSLLI